MLRRHPIFVIRPHPILKNLHHDRVVNDNRLRGHATPSRMMKQPRRRESALDRDLRGAILVVVYSFLIACSNIGPTRSMSSSDSTDWACSCGCCTVPSDKEGSCVATPSFLGLVASGNAQCTGEPIHDAAYCRNQCSIVYGVCSAEYIATSCVSDIRNERRHTRATPPSDAHSQH